MKDFRNTLTTVWEENLNQQQLKVVKEGDGPSLVLAGAGSGKTRVLIHRLAYILSKGVPQNNIMLVTFTNKAAKEMINRAELLLKIKLNHLWAGTFHHVGNIILRREASILNYSPNFTIIDKDDAKDLIEDCIEELGFNKKHQLFPKKNVISSILSFAINSQKEIDEVIIKYHPQIEEFTQQIKRVIAYYQRRKKESNLMDFDDLLLNWLKLMKIPEISEKYADLFHYILVDEYQDTNRLQYEILKRCASKHKNILVVGDDAQSIYSFRSASIENILDFPKTFENAKIFKLETNYRSTPQILNMANEIIKKNINQFPKTLNSIKQAGELPKIIAVKDVYKQARFVVDCVLGLNREGIPLEKIAVLFRSRYQALELEMELLKSNIPYIIRGGQRFFEQAHIKDIMAYLKIIINPRDELSFKRAILLHSGIGRSYAHKIWTYYIRDKKTVEEIKAKIPKRAKEGFQTFINILSRINKLPPQKAIKEILNYYTDYCYLTFDDPADRIADLEELSKMAQNYTSIKSFVLDLNSYEDFKGETMLDASIKENILVLSTIHQAKGLEWEAVFIIGFNDYDFPHPRALNNPDELEEERRLFYVAVTRSKSLLYIIYPQEKYTFRNGLILTRPSMFYYELPSYTYQEILIKDEKNSWEDEEKGIIEDW